MDEFDALLQVYEDEPHLVQGYEGNVPGFRAAQARGDLAGMILALAQWLPGVWKTNPGYAAAWTRRYGAFLDPRIALLLEGGS